MYPDTIPVIPAGTTFGVECAFRDESKVLITPNSAVWSLLDQHGNIINSRSTIAITPIDDTVTIVLSGADTEITEDTNSRTYRRFIRVNAVYTSSLGSDLPLVNSMQFLVSRNFY